MTDARTRAATRMAHAAQNFLDNLNEEQRGAAQWPFPANEERLRWYYTPTDHGGLPLSDMRPKQQQLALKVLASGLSRPAYVTACTIIGLDNILDELEGWSATWGRERGRDPGLYYLRVFGEPGGDGAWSWRFGGHHISIHHLVADGAVRASTPLFLGADPAASPFLGGYELRPLGSAEDLGRELLTSLDKEKRAPAVISPVPPFDLIGANRAHVQGGELPLRLPEVWRGRFEGDLGERVETLQRQLEEGLGITDEHLEALRFTLAPKGISAEDLSGPQRRLLRDIVAVYVSRLPDDLANAELERYTEEHLKRLTFAWAGGAEVGVPHYYRVQGPRLLIEYDNAQRGGNHAHSVWRDPEADFGMDILSEHHLEGHRL
ncbi:MAG: DUF3500 domain-containing protein [Actinomycetota bacterium]